MHRVMYELMGDPCDAPGDVERIAVVDRELMRLQGDGRGEDDGENQEEEEEDEGASELHFELLLDVAEGSELLLKLLVDHDAIAAARSTRSHDLEIRPYVLAQGTYPVGRVREKVFFLARVT